MIGQKNLVEKINNLTLSSFNCPILFIGPLGCGKRTFAKYTAEQLKIAYAEINKDYTKEDILNIYLCPTVTLYYIDLSEFTEAQQNQFLKFIEEPGKDMRFILGTSSETRVLDTILNRCIRYKFETYSEQELKDITHTEGNLIYKVFNTPGLIQNQTEESVKNLLRFCDNIVSNVNKVSSTKALTWGTEINYKEEYDKYDFYSVFLGIKFVAMNFYLKNNTDESLKIYLATQKAFKELEFKGLSKENFMMRFLLQLREVIL